MKYKYIAQLGTMILAFLLIGCGSKAENTEEKVKSFISDSDVEAALSSVEKEAVVEFNESDYYEAYGSNAVIVSFEGSDATISGEGATEEQGVLTITKGGKYVLSGSYDGRISIAAGESEQVWLYLNNVSVTSKKSPALTEDTAGKVIISIVDGTTNVFTDSEQYSYDFSAYTACMHFNDSVTINGNGTLNIYGKTNYGICSKDSLIVMSGNTIIDALNDGVVASNQFILRDGCVSINSGRYGIKTTNEENGTVTILGGIVNVKSGKDGINSVRELYIYAGVLGISAVDDGLHSGGSIVIEDGVITVYDSTKGVEGTLIYVKGGNLTVNASDDGMNATNGNEDTFDNTPFDQKADPALNAENYKTVQVSGTETGSFQTLTDYDNVIPTITITGGKVIINASGDGIDSNGNIVIEGGYIWVDGPTESINGSIDYDGALIMNGGTLIATGSSGMYQSISKESELSVINYFSLTEIAANSSIIIADGNTTLCDFKTQKSGNTVLFCSEKLELGKTYTLVVNGVSANVTAEAGGGYNGFAGGDFGNYGSPKGLDSSGER